MIAVPSRHVRQPTAPAVTRSAPVPVSLKHDQDVLGSGAALRFRVEVAASNALDSLPQGYEPVRVVVHARRKRVKP